MDQEIRASCYLNEHIIKMRANVESLLDASTPRRALRLT